VLAKLNYLWRAAATGIAFTIFGLGGFVGSLTLFPLIAVLPIDANKRLRLGQRVVHRAFRFYIWVWRLLGIYTWEIDRVEELRKPGQLIIANHPTLIDVVFLLSFIPEANCVVKRAMFRNPFTWGVVSAGRYISNSGGAKLVDDCAEVLASGNSLVIFPEGTRTTPGQRSRVQRGTANVALRDGLPIRPVLINCSPIALNKQMPWYQPSATRMHFTFQVLEPLETAELAGSDIPPSLKSRELNRRIEMVLGLNMNSEPNISVLDGPEAGKMVD
jgi:1-acyl-sn-glycerol-3-phosphate acyltransferase